MWNRAAGISWRGVICWGLDTTGEADYSGGRRNPPTPEPKAFTRQGLTKGFSEIHQALATFEAQDLNMERFTKVSRGIIDLLQCKKEILDGKRMLSVQSKLEQCFKKVERPAPFTSAASTTTEPLPSTSAASTTPASLPSY